MPPDDRAAAAPGALLGTLLRVKLWHLAVLMAFVAAAIQEIRAQRMTEPTLVGLAAVGFAGYAVLAWLAWAFASRLAPRLGQLMVVVLYLSAMAGLFFAATLIYLAIEHGYRVGW